MNYKDLVWLSYTDLSEKKVRAILTVIMVVIGVASIVALVSLTEGISASIQTELSALGPTTIIITSTSSTGFTLADTSQISALPNVSAVIPIVSGSATVIAGSENVSSTIDGVSPQDLDTLLGQNVSILQGSMYADGPSPAALFSKPLAFPSTSGGVQNIFVGSPVKVEIQSGRTVQNTEIPVSGIINVTSSPLIPQDIVLMSLSAAQLLLHRNSFNVILVKAKNTSSVTPLSNLITQIYGNRANVINTQQIAATAATIIGAITDLLVVIAGISLLVAAIGIMNVMLMSVMERTHEIGIMKSLGFRNKDILTLFLFQALLVGFVGGVIGIGVGTGASYGLAALSSHASSTSGSGAAGTGGGSTFAAGGGGGGARFGGGGGSFGGGGGGSSSGPPSFTPVLSISTILSALFVAMFVSGAAGLYPAWRASKMEPIDALRVL